MPAEDAAMGVQVNLGKVGLDALQTTVGQPAAHDGGQHRPRPAHRLDELPVGFRWFGSELVGLPRAALTGIGRVSSPVGQNLGGATQPFEDRGDVGQMPRAHLLALTIEAGADRWHRQHGDQAGIGIDWGSGEESAQHPQPHPGRVRAAGRGSAHQTHHPVA